MATGGSAGTLNHVSDALFEARLDDAQPGPLAWGQTGIDRTQQVYLGFPQCELAFVNFRDPPGQLIVRGVGPNGLSQLIESPCPPLSQCVSFPQ